MNFFFQSAPGKEAFWGISHDTVFTVSITLFVFFCGILANRWIENRKEKNRLNELRIYFFTLAASIPNSLEKLITEYKKLVNNVLDPKSHDYFLPETHQLYLDNVNKLSHTDILKALVGKRKRDEIKTASEHFRNLFDTFEYLRFQRERMRVNFNQFMQDASNYINTWNNSMDFLEQRFQELLTIAKFKGTSPRDDDFLRELDSLFDGWTKIEDYINIFVAKEHLLEPLRALCNKYSSDPRVTLFYPLGTKLFKAHNELKAMKELFGESFQEEVSELRKQTTRFKQAIDFFQSAADYRAPNNVST